MHCPGGRPLCSRVTQATRDHAGAGVRQAGHQPRGAARAAAQGSQVRAPALAHLRLQVGGGGGGQCGIELETEVRVIFTIMEN